MDSKDREARETRTVKVANMDSRPPLYLRVLAYVLLVYATAGIFSFFAGEQVGLDGIALVVVYAVAGWALLSAHRTGYWMVVLIALFNTGGGIYLLTLGQDLGGWTTPIGVWVFLVPGVVIGSMLLFPGSRRWVSGKKVHVPG